MERLQVLKNHIQEQDIIELNDTSSTTGKSIFSDIPLAPPDSILGVAVAFNKDTSPNKVNLSIGAYRTDEGKPYVLKAVRIAEEEIVKEKLNKEYAPQSGLAEFNKSAQELLLGKEHIAIKEQRVCTFQSLSGTGALRLGFEFLKLFAKGSTVYLPSITWGNHYQILDHLEMKYVKHPYWNEKTKGLDFKGMLSSIEGAPKKSIILLHMCSHNPTGVDPSEEEWKLIGQVCKEKEHIVFFDNAYQGYASGDLVKDSYSLRCFLILGLEVIVAQSFAKNFGLYGERIGAIHFILKDKKTTELVFSQVNVIARVLYSNPPLHGARIVHRVLSNETLHDLWKKELKEMADRIITMRQSLVDELKNLNTPGDWSHITKQIGMFSFTGLTPKQVERMVNEYHIYMLSNGRISMAGLNSKNVAYVAKAMHNCVTNEK